MHPLPHIARCKAAGSGSLREIVAGSSIELASCLLDSGAKIDGMRDPEKPSSLMVAVGEGYLDMVTMLLDRGASTTLSNQGERDAIAIVNGSDHDGLVRLLQAHRCELEIRKMET